MVADLATLQDHQDWPRAELLGADACEPHPSLEEGSVDLVVSSAPYLNNFDYADRTRLETYVLGQYTSWQELTDQVRRRLVMCATPQLDHLRPTVEDLLAEVTVRDEALGTELTGLVAKVAKARKDQKGNKRFDLVMAGYFGDMLRVLAQTRRVLKPGAGRY